MGPSDRGRSSNETQEEESLLWPLWSLPCLLSKDVAESKGRWIWPGFGGCWVALLVDPSLALACFVCFLVLILLFMEF